MTKDEALQYVLSSVNEYNERARADGHADPKIDEALEVLRNDRARRHYRDNPPDIGEDQ